MKLLDRVLQRWRIAKVRPYIQPGARVLDIGSADGALFHQLGSSIGASMGIDPTLKADTSISGHPLVAGFFPKDMPKVPAFDAITMLAVLEHFPPSAYAELQRGCAQFLKPGGLLLITVPAAAVDRILEVLKFLRLIDGMSLEEHHGYDVSQTNRIFPEPNFRLKMHRRFQLGLNHLFVFERIMGAEEKFGFLWR
jgi:cyclopropane fatty-acyl-phospholipid synthase-like methyltransferase